MHRNRAIALGLGASVGALGIPLLVSCLSDPREEDPDIATPVCDSTNYKTKLSADPTNAEASLQKFVEASLQLKAATEATENELKDACNALAGELQLPQGADLKAACQQLAKRVDAINAALPAAAAPNAYPAQVRFGTSCDPKPGSLEACL